MMIVTSESRMPIVEKKIRSPIPSTISGIIIGNISPPE